VRTLLPLLLLVACDDTVLIPCGSFTPDWHGVNCTLQVHCISCHGDVHDNPPVQFTVLPGDLITDINEGRGELVVPGEPGQSRLWRVLSGEIDPVLDYKLMPLGTLDPLPDSQIDHVREWIETGALIEEGW